MTSLYDELGVPPEASDSEIRKGYRQAAKKAHPDSPGGSREKFDRLSTALAVLTDKSKRDQYDRTGKIDEPEADTREGKSKQLAFMQLCAVFAELEKIGRPIERCDVIDLAIKGLQDQIKSFNKQLAAAEKDEQGARKLAARFHAKGGGQNFIRSMLEARAADVEVAKVRLRKDRELSEMAINVLKEHTFEVDKTDPFSSSVRPGYSIMDMTRA